MNDTQQKPAAKSFATYWKGYRIMGNSPFVGVRLMEQGSVQKKEVQDIFGNIKDVQDLDYITCWYKLAVEYIQNTRIQACFVLTNSIC